MVVLGGDGGALCKEPLWPGGCRGAWGTPSRAKGLGFELLSFSPGQPFPRPPHQPPTPEPLGCPLTLPCPIQTTVPRADVACARRMKSCSSLSSPLLCLKPSPSLARGLPPTQSTLPVAGKGIVLKCRLDHVPVLSETF